MVPMNAKKVASLVVLIVIQVAAASALTCLGCDNVIQPRHCHRIANCKADEVCGAETVQGMDGYLNYKLGCVKQNACPAGNAWSNGSFCRQCCSSDLCNAEVCGEPGYPLTRGPICYDCQYHNSVKPCRTISFCSMTEECSVARQEEFGDVILISSCRQRNFCPTTDVPMIGKRSALQGRSGNHILCEECCKADLCNLNCSNNDWEHWTSWSPCSVNCGGGDQTRHRNCSLPQGSLCSGNHTEKKACNTYLCPVDGEWGQWKAWSSCSVTCGTGVRIRHRDCEFNSSAPHGAYCNGSNEESLPCSLVYCPVDGLWSQWTVWSGCSVTCGAGVVTRTRMCAYPDPVAPHGKNCTGIGLEEKSCNSTMCPVDGAFGMWSNWSPCTLTCGTGTQRRVRNCTFDAFAPHGKDCDGNITDIQNCNIQLCPVDGLWNSWSNWTQCSQTCGVGTQYRTRQCEFIPTAPHGDNCSGSNIQQQNCSFALCPAGGQWTTWEKWSVCSKSCGTGTRSRTRLCLYSTGLPHGQPCAGNDTDTESCNVQLCPVDGIWSQWTSWGSCSASCGPGVHQRTRTCEYSVQAPHGNACFGSYLDQKYCNTTACAVDGVWQQWGNWQPCTETCGGGMQIRKRVCYFPSHVIQGDYCTGRGAESQSCNTDPCQGSG